MNWRCRCSGRRREKSRTFWTPRHARIGEGFVATDGRTRSLVAVDPIDGSGTEGPTRDDSLSSDAFADAVFLAELDRLIADGLVYVEVDDEIPRFGVTREGVDVQSRVVVHESMKAMRTVTDAADDPDLRARELAARWELARDVDEFLAAIAQYAVPNELRQALHDFVLQKFDQVLPLHSSRERVLVQLVREAYRALNEPDADVNLKDWSQAAVAAIGPIVPLSTDADPRD